MEDIKEKEAQHEIYECSGCGANLKYLPEQESLFCEYCQTTISLKGEASKEELDFLSNIDNVHDEWSTDAVVVACDNCVKNEEIDPKLMYEIAKNKSYFCSVFIFIYSYKLSCTS